MTRFALPAKHTRSHALLLVLLDGPGTFYQICERAGLSIEKSHDEFPLRQIFGTLIGGHARLDGITYSIKPASRAALTGATSAPYVGKVAGPAFRGTPYMAPVTVIRRAEVFA